MRFEILLAPEAGKQLATLPAHTRAEVRDAVELHHRHEPTKHPEFLRRIAKARADIAAGRGVKLEDVPR